MVSDYYISIKLEIAKQSGLLSRENRPDRGTGSIPGFGGKVFEVGMKA